MLNRREFVTVAGLAAFPAPALWAIPGISAASASDPGLLYAVVYDDRFVASARFGAQAHRLGYGARAVSGDVTPLWYDDLYHRWKRGPAAIAGLTTPETAMCLKLFGADAGLRCVFEAEHRFRPAEPAVEHRVRAPDGLGFAALAESGELWPELMLELLGKCPIAPARRESTVLSAVPVATPEDQPRLVSWLFAPLHRR
jgi:hypothetical protein